MNPPQVPEQAGKPRPTNTAVSLKTETFEGPLPHPAILQAYEQLMPGAAERLLKMAESQSQHRREIERIVVSAGARDSLLGSIFAFLIAISAFVWAGYALVRGESSAAVATVIATIGGLVGVFAYGKHVTMKERLGRRALEKPGTP